MHVRYKSSLLLKTWQRNVAMKNWPTVQKPHRTKYINCRDRQCKAHVYNLEDRTDQLVDQRYFSAILVWVSYILQFGRQTYF